MLWGIPPFKNERAAAMETEHQDQGPVGHAEAAAPEPAPKKDLSPAAQRALAEAEARRADRDAAVEALPKELKGRGGKEPTRYGDWEKDGIISDF